MQSKARKILRIGITIGDINGIGPELVIRAFTDQRLREMCTPIIYGSSRVLNIYRKILSVDKFSYNVIQKPNQANPRKISVIDCIRITDRVEVGKPTPDGGAGAYEALTTAVADLKNGDIDALVTLPIDKKMIQRDEFKFPGHTEYLTQEFNADDSLMFMIHDHLKVGVVTGHVPVKDIASNLSTELIVRKIKLMHASLKKDFSIDKPRIAVMGLNPHAGDNGLIGKEEQEMIIKAVEQCANNRMLVLGPYGADGFFGSGTYTKFDGILAMYHDQGLTPFKLLAGFEGVNYTAGLPIVRTSPDHGVAYNLAGKRQADITSFVHAIYDAIDIFRRRRDEYELDKNSIWNNRPPIQEEKPQRRDDRRGSRNDDRRGPRNDDRRRQDDRRGKERNERNERPKRE
ncbi:MAG: 4-hydroxythreonine-4-phosphate dehydrogenase PdxA, partial [Bacteroidota bacterium]